MSEDKNIDQNEKNSQDVNQDAASPRDKKMKRDATGDVPLPESQPRPAHVRNLLVAASPPKFINIEDVMQLANGMTDMALAHEIAIGKEFHLDEIQPDPGSLQGRIKEIMHTAFWDVLAESINEDPPDYTQALVLLQEIKQELLSLLMPHSQRFRANIEEVLDLTLIEQQAEHGSLDFQRYATFIIDTMAAICAPVRDELVASLRNLSDIVSLYREILKALQSMKVDMVNFTISHFRPIVQQHSVEYERKKFQSLLDIQKENGVDGLEFTRSWLLRNIDKSTHHRQEQQVSAEVEAGATAADTATSCVPRSDNSTVMNAAFMELLDWDDDSHVFPETLLIDQQRFMELRDQVRWLTLVASVLIVTYSSVGAPISGLSDLKDKLTRQVSILTKQVPPSQLPETMLNVAEQVTTDVNQSLTDRGFPAMKPDQQELLRGQITAVLDSDNAVHRLMRGRLLGFIEKVLANPRARDMQLPPGYSAVAEDLGAVVGQFLRLTNYNQAVFGSYYSDIISSANNQQTRASADQ